MASAFNPNEYEPPSGIKLTTQGDNIRMTVRVSLAGRILVTLIYLLLVFAPMIDEMFDLDLDLFNDTRIYFLVVGFVSIIYVGFMLTRTVIELTPKEMRVRNLPWRIPFSRTFKLKNINRPEIDTVERTHRDKYGNEHSTYTFKVQLALINDHWHPVIYSTGNEPQADFILGSLKWYLAKYQAYDPSRY